LVEYHNQQAVNYGKMMASKSRAENEERVDVDGKIKRRGRVESRA
jgi:hypothetical protein